MGKEQLGVVTRRARQMMVRGESVDLTTTVVVESGLGMAMIVTMFSVDVGDIRRLVSVCCDWFFRLSAVTAGVCPK